VFQIKVMAAICLLASVASPASSTLGRRATTPPRGTIGVVSSADFETVFLLTAATGAVSRVRAPDTVIGLRVDISTDGKRLAATGSKGIWIFSRRGTGARRVIAAAPTAFAPDWVGWSPSARELVFTLEGALFTVAASGMNSRKLLHRGVYAPDWSPNGTRIVFVRNPNSRTGGGFIQSISADGRELRSIVRGGHPDVSPDGSSLAFARRDGVYVMPMVGGEPKRIVRNGEHPEWSPDGRHLAFTRGVDCGHAGCVGRAFIVPAIGGSPRAIGPRVFDIGPLSWST
jgi:Tol biopolymer transport system component